MKERQNYINIFRILIIIPLLWVIGFILCAVFKLFTFEHMNHIINSFELLFGITEGVLLLVYAKKAKDRNIMMGTAFAILSWTLGQLFWYSYSTITGEALPYPSVSDLGFTGTYFLLIGVISMIPSSQPRKPRGGVHYTVFLLVVIPVVLLWQGTNKIEALIYNFVLTLSMSVAIYKCISIIMNRRYRLFVYGIFLLGITDILFMIHASIYPDAFSFVSDSLYPVSLALISFGVLKGGEMLYD